MATNEVLILGSGVEEADDGRVRLNVPGQQRVDRFLEYFDTNHALFRSREARVTCAGGYALLAHGVQAPDAAAREGNVMAEYLFQHGIPARIIQTETESTSTLTNLTNTINEGLIQPGNYSEEHQLGIITHPHHLKRVIFLAGKLGIAKAGIEQIPTRESDSAFREFLLLHAYRTMLLGTDNPETMERRERETYGRLAGPQSK